MGIKSVTKSIVKPFVDVKGWFGYSSVKSSTNYVSSLVRGLWSKPEELPPETFEQAAERLGLNETKIAHLRGNYIKQTIIYGVFSLGVLGYAVYMLAQAAFLAAFISLLIMSLGVVCTYRAHFWVYQLSVRRLGCTFKDWFHATFKLKG